MKQSPTDTQRQNIFRTLSSRPWLILTITTFMTLSAIIYAFFMVKPVYEVQSMIRLGKISGNQVESLTAIKEELAFTYQLYTPRHKNKLPILSRVNISGQDEGLLLIGAIGRNNEDAVKLLRTEIDTILERQAKAVKEALKVYKGSVKNTELQLQNAISSIQKSQQEINGYSQKITKLTKEDVALMGTYLLEIWKHRSNIDNGEKWQAKVSNHLERTKFRLINTIPPQEVNKIVTNTKPARPRKTLIITVAFVSGLLISLLLVLFLDFLSSRKEENN